MKKLFLLMSMAAAMIPFAGCQKNEIKDPTLANGEGSTFELVADISQTKTTLDGLNVEWENGDIIYVVTTDKLWGADWSEENPNLESIAEFKYEDGKFSTEKTIADGEHTFNAMYARDEQKSYHRGASSTHKLVATQQQNCTAPTAHIKDNDALVGTFTATTPMAAPAQVAMKHLYTMMQVNIKNNTGADVEVKKFEMTTAADLAGVFNVTSFDTPAITTKSGAVKTITVEVSGGTVANTASLPIYFVMAPLSEYSGDVTFKVTDAENKTYTKTVTVSDLTFEAGAYNTTPYTITEADEVAAEVYGLVEVDGAFEDNGKYVLAFKDGKSGDYTFINNKGTSNTLVKDALTVANGVITNPDAAYVFTAIANGDGFNLKNSNNKFIYNSGSNTTLNTNYNSASVWFPTFLSASSTYKINGGSITGRYITYYSEVAKAYANSNFKDQVANGTALDANAGAISVFKLGYAPVVTPKIIVPELEKTALADAESIVIPYSTDNISGSITATVTSDEDGMVNGTPVVEADKVIVSLNVNNSEDDKTATITLSYDGAEDAVVTITQYASASINSGLKSLYEIISSTDQAEPDEFVVSVTGATVTYVSGNTAFIEDATAGMIIYMSSHGLVAGNVLNGTLTGKAYIRYGVCQISDFDFTGEKTNGIVPVTTITVAELLENYSSYVSRRVKIENAIVTDAVSGTSDKNGTISQNENIINLYNNASSVSFVQDDVVDLFAYPSYYNDKKQLATYEAPVSKKVAAPSISCSNNDVTITCSTAGATIYYAIDEGEYLEYTEPFPIDEDCTVKAYATKDGLIDSEVVTVNLTWVDPDADEDLEPITLSVVIKDYVTKNNCKISAGNNVTKYKTLTLDDVITLIAGGTGQNEGSFWNNGTEWRLYQSGSGKVTVSAATGYTINSVKFTYAASNGGTLKNGSNNVSTGALQTVNNTSATYNVGNTGSKTNGQVKITAVEIVYQKN